jgi:hypothetical protein
LWLVFSAKQMPEIMPLVGCSTALILMLFGLMFYRPAPKNYSALEDDQELVARLARLERILQLLNIFAFISTCCSAYMIKSIDGFGLIAAIWLIMAFFCHGSTLPRAIELEGIISIG